MRASELLRIEEPLRRLWDKETYKGGAPKKMPMGLEDHALLDCVTLPESVVVFVAMLLFFWLVELS